MTDEEQSAADMALETARCQAIAAHSKASSEWEALTELLDIIVIGTGEMTIEELLPMWCDLEAALASHEKAESRTQYFMERLGKEIRKFGLEIIKSRAAAF